MMEVAEEATHVPSHRQRTVLFLSAMRHCAAALERRGFRVHYIRLDDPANTQTLDGEMRRACRALRPARLRSVRPGEWRVQQIVDGWQQTLGIPVELLEDEHFLLTPADFDGWASGRQSLVLEHFYRMMRRRLGVLIDAHGRPAGGRWNFDAANRKRLPRGARPPTRPRHFRPDSMTREVMALVEERFPDAPGTLDDFGWPVSRRAARLALADFVEHRLPHFGDYQDAMALGEPWLYHSLLAAPLNLKLLDPRECVDAAVAALERGDAPLNSVEGFVRQVIGWREFVRGVYWREGRSYGERNALGERGTLPAIYWTGDTDMVCMQEALSSVLRQGYAHHIQRLMVTGNFALIAGVHPRAVSDWYLAMYVDAVDWVTLPNTLGMVMHADGGVVGTKPYAASGRYIQRMSDSCTRCRFDPGARNGETACPFTVFYWDFLLRHARRWRRNPRMRPVMRWVDAMPGAERRAIRAAAARRRHALGITPSGDAEGSAPGHPPGGDRSVGSFTFKKKLEH
jgi:deoxyribodipyrimidine photolyase-related protein